MRPLGEITERIVVSLSRDQLHQLARRVRHNGYRRGMESFVIEREDIADTLERMAEEVGT